MRQSFPTRQAQIFTELAKAKKELLTKVAEEHTALKSDLLAKMEDLLKDKKPPLMREETAIEKVSRLISNKV